MIVCLGGDAEYLRLLALNAGYSQRHLWWVLLQKSKSAIFDGCNPLKYRDTILDKSVKNQFLQQNPPGNADRHHGADL
jgi:hypothetical protein